MNESDNESNYIHISDNKSKYGVESLVDVCTGEGHFYINIPQSLYLVHFYVACINNIYP